MVCPISLCLFFLHCAPPLPTLQPPPLSPPPPHTVSKFFIFYFFLFLGWTGRYVAVICSRKELFCDQLCSRKHFLIMLIKVIGLYWSCVVRSPCCNWIKKTNKKKKKKHKKKATHTPQHHLLQDSHVPLFPLSASWTSRSLNNRLCDPFSIKHQVRLTCH